MDSSMTTFPAPEIGELISLDGLLDLDSLASITLDFAGLLAMHQDKIRFSPLGHPPYGMYERKLSLGEVITEYNSLPNDHPVKAKALALNIPVDALCTYLSYAIIDTLPITQLLYLRPDGEWLPGVEPILKWIEDQKVFDTIKDAVVFPMIPGALTVMHNHPKGDDDQFIWIRPMKTKEFFVLGPDENRVFITGHSCWFNDQTMHGSIPSWTPSYSVRINGTFSSRATRFISAIRKSVAKADAKL